MCEIVLSGVAEYPEMAALEVSKMLCIANLKAPKFEETTERPPVQICAVIDRSGSMRGAKLNLVIEALEFVVRELQPKDQFGVVCYDHQVTVPVKMCFMTKDNQKSALQAIRSIRPGGATNLSGGLLAGMQCVNGKTPTPEVVGVPRSGYGCGPAISRNRAPLLNQGLPVPSAPPAPAVPAPPAPTAAPPAPSAPSAPKEEAEMKFDEVKKPDGARTVWLFTDGHANEGIRTTEGIISAMDDLMKDSTETSVFTFGFGEQHNDAMLRAIAEAGAGMYYFIEKPEVIPEAFAECLGGLLTVVASDITLSVRPASDNATILQVLGGDKADVANVCFRQKDMYSEEERDFVLEVQLDKCDPLKEQAILSLELTYKTKDGDEKKATADISVDRVEALPEGRVPNEKVDIQRNRLDAANAMKEAQAQAALGDYAHARRTLEVAKERVATSTTANVNFCHELTDDLDEIQMMCTASAWEAKGKKSANRTEMEHSRQRACGSKKKLYSNTKQAELVARTK